MAVRRVVTGHNEAGKAVFASDENVEPVTVALAPGMEFYRLWEADEVPRFPDAGSQESGLHYFPPLGGFRFGLVSIPPNSTVVGDPTEADVAELEEKMPGLAQHIEPDNPGMHTTATVDYEVVLSGRVVLELDDGASTELGPGDTVVQNGTRHAWRNPFDEPCLFAVVLIGAHHDKL